MNGLTQVRIFHNRETGRDRRIEISDHVQFDNSKAHVVGLGRQNIEILFYPGQKRRGRKVLNAFAAGLEFLGTQHN